LIGALVGAAIVFFLGTEKGKKVLKIISEKGLDDVSSVLGKAEKSADLEEVFEEDMQEEPAQEKKIIAKEEPSEDKPKIKRFFRGISRHLN
jgi:hypothetical protein